MRFMVLGGVEAMRGARLVDVGGGRQRALLALLLIHSGEVVSRDRLIDALWGGEPPASASRSLDAYVARLRRAFREVGAEGLLQTRAPGYVLQTGDLDATRFACLAAAGRGAVRADDPARAVALLDEALALWHGTPFAPVADEPWARDEVTRLEELRLGALEDRIDAELGLGRHAAVTADLDRLASQHPFRERLVAQRMLALYRCGRQADALAVYREAHRRLVEDFGLEPGPGLRRLQVAVLHQDPSLDLTGSLDPPAQSSEEVERRHGQPHRTVAAAAIVAAAIAVAVFALGTLREPARGVAGSVTGPALVKLSATSARTRAVMALDGTPAAAASGDGSLWLADPDAGRLSRIDAGQGAVAGRISLGGNPGVVAVGGGSVWVAGVPGDTVTRIDPATESVTQTIDLSGGSAAALAFGAGGLWVADTTDRSLILLDAATGTVRRTVALDVRPSALAVGAGAVWAADYDAHLVVQVDPRSGRSLATVPVGNGPVALSVAGGAVWVANALDSTVSRIDPARGAVTATIAIASGPIDIAAAKDAVWVAGQYSGTLSRIDPRRGEVVRTVRVGGAPTSIAVAGDTLWATVRPRAEHTGGTLVMVRRDPFPVDPGRSVGMTPFQSTNLAYDGLVTYNHVAGPRGMQLVPDLALTLPVPTDGGRTYTFRLRPGIRYSDGGLVRPDDFRRGIERALRVHGVDIDQLDGITGARACISGARCDLRRGIVVDDQARTVTFHLDEPDPNFLADLANGGLSVPVPPGTPMRDAGLSPIPGTGPYKVANADSAHIRYVRNPRFREWSHAAQPSAAPDAVVWRFGLTPDQQARAVARGHADWMADVIPGALLPGLRARFAGRLHSYPSTDTEFLRVNTRHPPFDDGRVRRALNLAIDRRVIVRIWGGDDAATPTCQLLPPGVPGYRRYCPYTAEPSRDGRWSAPDITRARRLVAASGTRAMRVTVWGWNDDSFAPPSMTRYTAAVLRRLGYRTRVKLVSHAQLADPPARVFRAITIIPGGWLDPAPDSFLSPWVTCSGVNNRGAYCRERVDAAVRRARSLGTTRPRAATRLWTALDHDIVRSAAFVPLINVRQVDFVSDRVRNLQHHAYLGPIVMQAHLQ